MLKFGRKITPKKPCLPSFSPVQVKFYDLGGGKNIRSIWDKYYHDAHGLLYVVDGADGARWEQSKDLFTAATTHKYLEGKVSRTIKQSSFMLHFEAYRISFRLSRERFQAPT